MNQKETLFTLPELPPKQPHSSNYGKIRLNSPIRHQVTIQFSSLDDMLPEDHRARIIWDYVKMLDLSKIFRKIQVVDGGVGRSATDPYLLLALWLYATVEGIGSARLIERYCSEHIAFQWLCGQVKVNYHSIADFRVDHREELNDLLTQSVAILLKKGLIQLKRIAQDGTKVRAAAGSSSFRREKTLNEYLKEATEHLETLEKEVTKDPGKHTSQVEARRKRSIVERKTKVEDALKELATVRAEIKENKAKKKEIQAKIENARVSKTDCQARKMKMANGGFSPAYNVQFATETKSQVIFGVDVVNKGCDYGLITPMMKQLNERYELMPDEWLADPGYRKISDIENAAKFNKDCKVYVPLMESDKKVLHKEGKEVKAWRTRMEKNKTKTIYKERASTAECVNAIARNRGLQQFLITGLNKVQCVALLFAITHNVMRGISLMGL